MIRRASFAFAACALLAWATLAFTYRLSPEQVREAYFLGRDPEKRQGFFNKYIHFLKLPDRGPDVHLVEFRTPYELVALRSQEHWANYDALDAEEDYAAHRDEVIVRILIWETPTFYFSPPDGGAQPGRLWPPESYVRDFKFRVSQDRPIAFKKLTAQEALQVDPSSFGGFDVSLHFDTGQFAPGTVKIEVIAPGGQVFATTFDLDQLK